MTTETKDKDGSALPESAGSVCECSQWAEVRGEHRMLTGHHKNCHRSPDPLGKALALIAKLARGMECWAADEDGIHPDAWEAYRRAKALEGVFLSNVGGDTRHE